MSKNKNGEKIVQKIVASALQSCIEQGLPHLKMTEIALKAGISMERVLFYFEDKEMLIKYIAQEHLINMKKHLQIEQSQKTINILLQNLELNPIIDEEESHFLPIFSEAFLPYLLHDSFVQDYKSFFQELLKVYTEIIEERIKNKELQASLNSQALAHTLISMLDGAVLHKGLLTPQRSRCMTLVKKAMELFKIDLWQSDEEKLVA